MNSRSAIVIAALVAGAAGGCKWPGEVPPGEELAVARTDKKLMAFYYTWYGTEKVHGSIRHWEEGGHRPHKMLPNGMPDTGTTNHPKLGIYDSRDPDLINEHLRMVREAGIDVLICTWWGQDGWEDKVFETMLPLAEKTPVKLTVYYEAVPNREPARALEDLHYILARYGTQPAFFRLHGSPVVFIYGRAMNQIPKQEWKRIADTVKERYNALLIADSRKPVDGFAGTHVYNPVGAIVRKKDMNAFYAQDAGAARAAGVIYAATIIPGYDDGNIGRKSVTVADREGGQLYERQWADALAADPDWVIVTSWNELHEGSEIEPTHEHGDMFLKATARWSRKFKSK